METSHLNLRSFFFHKKPLIFKKNSIALHQGSSPQGVYYLERGYIKDSVLSVSGQEFTLFVFRPGDIFPYNWVFNGIPNDHSFTAVTECTVFIKPKEEFLQFIKNNPPIHFELTQNILIRMRGVMQRLEQLALGNAEIKVASIFIILAERFGRVHSGVVHIQLPISHKDIAEFVGITRETASIEINKLEKKGILKRSSKYYVVKRIRALQEIVSSTSST